MDDDTQPRTIPALEPSGNEGHQQSRHARRRARGDLARVPSDQADAFWQVLARHDVAAYLCSRIIAFDVQAHDGVLQILTGGAGTEYGPDGFMPGATEYHHAVQMAIDARGLRYQVIDTDGRQREGLAWPMAEPDAERRTTDPAPGAGDIVFLQLAGVADSPPGPECTLLCGWDDREGPPTISVHRRGGRDLSVTWQTTTA